MSQDLSQFRQDVRNWLGDNFPKSLIGRGIEPFGGVEGEASIPEDASSWRDRLGEKGWGTPTWPSEYGGGGLTPAEAAVLSEEMHAAGAINPIPLLAGMGVTMVGPTILEYGTEEQKLKHLPAFAVARSGGVSACPSRTLAQTLRRCKPKQKRMATNG